MSGSQLGDFERLGIPFEVSVREGEGVDGSDRITIILPNGSVVDEYLQVNIYANQTTGLNNNDVFYFGNIVGDTGDSSTDARMHRIRMQS